MDNQQRLIELERRRRRGGRLLQSGITQAEVVRRVGVIRTSVSRWEQLRQEGGIEALRRPKRFGRPRRPAQCAVRAADRAECAAPQRPSAATRREGQRHLESPEVAGAKKIAARQGRVIVFIDESGLSERPCRARTWAPRGQTPILQYRFSWKLLSVIAGVSFWRFYLRLHPGTIRTAQVIEFLKALQATIGKKLLIIWDRLQAHRSKLVRQHVEAQRGALALEFLPAYVPELNPVECIWGYLKHHVMPNYCARDLSDLGHRAWRHLRSMQRRSTRVCAFWRQAELF